jgi:hypothetical protein
MFVVDAERQIFQPLAKNGRYVEVGVYKGAYSKEVLKYEPASMHLVDPYQVPSIRDFLPSDYEAENPENLLNKAFENYYPGGIEKALPEAFSQAIASLGNSSLVRFIKKSSAEAVDDFAEGAIDYLHLDANNRFDFVLANLRRWQSKLSSNGLIVVNNCYVSPIGEQQFVSALEAVSRFIKSSEWSSLAISNRWFSNVLLCRKSSLEVNKLKMLNLLALNNISFIELPDELIHSVHHKNIQRTSPNGEIDFREYLSFAN